MKVYGVYDPDTHERICSIDALPLDRLHDALAQCSDAVPGCDLPLDQWADQVRIIISLKEQGLL